MDYRIIDESTLRQFVKKISYEELALLTMDELDTLVMKIKGGMVTRVLPKLKFE